MRNAIFIFLNKTSGRKYIKTIALVSFLTFNKNITSFIWFMWPLFYMHSAHLSWIFFHGLNYTTYYTLDFNFELCLQLQSHCTSSSMKFHCRMFWHKNNMKYFKKKKQKKIQKFIFTQESW